MLPPGAPVVVAIVAVVGIILTWRLPKLQASSLTGILLGDDAGVPKSLQEAFRITGTSHILAISG